ncbi:LysR family transcriptional regulator [Ruegeria sp. ANG-S4]|uniref:LysR family transcriptional regulator n=1 Tax=Ruegeria sp. ANG-S4 TaxID=1577904 RepID=UPI00069070AE|nr:LysR family transcriptional regulator [Ruegeria sp. ANG-S4]
MSRRIPSLNWLRVFEAAARAGSFARAAERLAMSPPAVSQQIRALEAHLGRPLFDRAAAGVSLTEAGRNLLAVVGESLGRMESAAAAISVPVGPPLSVAVSKTLSVGWLSPRLPGFLDQHPHVKLELSSMVGRPEIPPRNATLWIAFGQPPPGTEALALFGEHLFPVAHPDIAHQIDDLGGILAFPLIEVSDHRKNWVQIFGGDLLPAQTRITYVDTTLSALALAAAKGGVALARPPASDHLQKSFGLVPCLTDFKLRGIEEYHILRDAGVQLSPDAKAFSDWICREANATRKLLEAEH